MGMGVVFSNTTFVETIRRVPDGMPKPADPLPPEFFTNLGCPPIEAAAKAIATEVPLNEATKEPEEIFAVEDHDRL